MPSYYLKLSSPKSYNFVTSDFTNYWYDSGFLTKWTRARFVNGSGWINASEDAPSGGFPNDPCGNITWWDATGNQLITFVGPGYRSALMTRRDSPVGSMASNRYRGVPSPVFASGVVPVRWTKEVWWLGVRYDTPAEVIGACVKDGNNGKELVILCAPELSSSGDPVQFQIYKYQPDEEAESNWELQAAMSYSDISYPADIATCNRTGTEGRCLVFGEGISPFNGTNFEYVQEIVFDLSGYSISKGRGFDSDNHFQAVQIGGPGSDRPVYGRELIGIDWDDSNTRVDLYYYINAHDTDPFVGVELESQVYMEISGGAYNGQRFWLDDRFEGAQIGALNVPGYVDLRTATVMITHSYWKEPFVYQFNVRYLYHRGEELLQHVFNVTWGSPEGVIYTPSVKAPFTDGYPPLGLYFSFRGPISPIDVYYVTNELQNAFDRVAVSPAEDIVVGYTQETGGYITNGTDPAPEFGLDPGDSVFPIRFGYKR